MSAFHPDPDSGQTSRAPRQTKQIMTPYFAYGSNLQLAQMAQRCPASIFTGRATLPGYRWQINQRGVANVVPCDEPGCKVEGLIYLISSKDEKSLDRSEGVARDFYQKHLLKMSFEPHERFAYYKTSGLAAALSGKGGVAEYDGVGSMGPGAAFGDVMGAETTTAGSPGFIKALVYMSKNYAEDGEIRSEYIGRMQKAIADALRLGVSQSFIDDSITPHLSGAFSPDMPGLPSRKRKVESKRKSGTLTAPETASRSKHTDMMELDTDQGSKPYILVREVSPRPGKRVDVKTLVCDNRERHHESRLMYPVEMLNLLLDVHAEDRQDDEAVFAVCCKERDMRSDQPRFSIPATTMDLELANEFAMKHFRQTCSRIPEMALGTWDRSDAEPCPRGALIWSLDKNGCLRLSITSQDGLDERTVWVNVQVLLKR